MHYVDFNSLRSSAAASDNSICRICAGKVVFETTEACIRGTGEPTASKVRAAADWSLVCCELNDVAPVAHSSNYKN